MRELVITCLVIFATAGVALGQGLTIWTTLGDQTLEWLQAEATTFSNVFEVPTNVVTLDLGELKQQALLAAPQGQAGDLFVGIPHDQIADFVLGGVAANMRSFATSAYLADLSEQARHAFVFQGNLVGLPMWVEGPALIVNNGLVDSVPPTYDEFIELAQSLTTDDTFGFMFHASNFYFAYGWINTFGGYVFGSDASGSLVADDVGIGTEGAIRGAQAVKDLQYTHGLIPAGTSYEVAARLFIDGALAMIYDGQWAIGQYQAAGLDISVHPMPPLADGSPFSGFMGVEGVLLNPFSDRLTDAANLAKWITRTEAQVSMAQLSGRIPASITALAQVQDDPFISGFGEALLDSEPIPNLPQMANVWGASASALSVILESEGSDVAAAMQRAASRIRGD